MKKSPSHTNIRC